MASIEKKGNEVIKDSEVNIINFRQNDPIGYVFSYEGEILRAIYADAKTEVDELLSSGLIEELVEKDLFPKTEATNYTINDEAYILKHEKVGRVTYPYEWSFSMIKDAAIAILEVNDIAAKYGYQTKDSHGFNLVFNFEGKPFFVDLGSFYKTENNFKGWIAYEEFIQSYYYPLVLWSKGHHFLAKQALANPPYNFPHHSFYKASSVWGKLFSTSLLKKYFNSYFTFQKISFFDDKHIVKKTPFGLGKIIVSLKNKSLLPFQKISFKKLKKQIKNIKNRTRNSMWDNYHSEHIKADGSFGSTERFDRIAEIINELEIKEIVEVGGNQGIVSSILIQNTTVEKSICTDYDDSAVDISYNRALKHNVPILPAVIDFAFPVSHTHKISASERLKSEAVLGLALTHHLILTQKLSLEYILDEMGKYSDKYIFIEFMPLGIYSSKSPNPTVPNWYTETWFKSKFEERFALLYQEQLDKNRILFVGKKLG